ncbi:RIO1-domain-containing protein [Clavulina sp. PMI_390]|nr:RIO1-domain-containing protein [Clavulina sp. PMI_390]
MFNPSMQAKSVPGGQAPNGDVDKITSDLNALKVAPPFDIREGNNFIDEEGALEGVPIHSHTGSDDEDELSEEEEEDEDDESSGYDSQLEAEAWNESIARVDDEDWEMAEGDFTKSYNRLKQHLNVRSGQALASAAANAPSNLVAPLPAVNRPRVAKTKASTQETSGPATAKPRGSESEQLALLSKYNSRIANISTPYALGYGLGGVATNRKAASEKANMKDKSDRATNEQVLDPRTRIILFKMINRGLIDEINGCVSTGKEANVYHALTPEGRHLALKIYKTSILVFKNRDKYVTGEHRFRNGYSRHNPRKMVKMWAEKEMRNLKRLTTAGIYAPEVLEVRENVLVIGFLGDEQGWASPRLKDAEIPESDVQSLYLELVIDVRRMYHLCHLVHADLSEYNILYHQSHLYVIDVSQSVEHDHPAAFDFLRADIKNVEEFWARRGARTLGLRRTFDFVIGGTVPGLEGEETDDALRQALSSLIAAKEQAGDVDDAIPPSTNSSKPAISPHQPTVLSRADIERLDEERANLKAKGHDEALEDAVFMSSYIPRNLNEVFDPERDAAKIRRGEGGDLIYGDVTGIVKANTKPDAIPEGDEDGEGDDDEEDDDDEEGDDDDEGGEGDRGKKRPPRGHRHEDPDAKRERKKAAKEEAREKRKQKMPKTEKKTRIKQTSGRGH